MTEQIQDKENSEQYPKPNLNKIFLGCSIKVLIKARAPRFDPPVPKTTKFFLKIRIPKLAKNIFSIIRYVFMP